MSKIIIRLIVIASIVFAIGCREDDGKIQEAAANAAAEQAAAAQAAIDSIARTQAVADSIVREMQAAIDSAAAVAAQAATKNN